MPWTITETGKAVVEFDGVAFENKLRAEAEAQFPQIANYPVLRTVQATREQPGNRLKLTVVFTSE